MHGDGTSLEQTILSIFSSALVDPSPTATREVKNKSYKKQHVAIQEKHGKYTALPMFMFIFRIFSLKTIFLGTEIIHIVTYINFSIKQS